MIKNYFKTAWRSLLNNKVFTALNLAGLTIGMAAALLIFAWVENELSYDQFHIHKAELFKVWNSSLPTNNNPISVWDVTTAALGPDLQQRYPEIKSVARTGWPHRRLFNYGDKALTSLGLDVDKPFLTMFSYPLLKGDAKHALDDPKDIVLTEKLAKKIFGNTDPMDKLVKVNNKDTYRVSGIMKDLPNNTQFDFEYLTSLASDQFLKPAEAKWNNNSYNTYVLLRPGANAALLGKKIKNIVLEHDKTTGEQVFLHPISKWRLYSTFENGKISGGRISTVKLMFAIACLILLIACINFMNMNTARSEKRAKEVGVRKVIGARRSSLIKQFLTESIILTAVAGLLSLVLVQLCLPAFNSLTDKNLSIEFLNPWLWLFLLGFVVFTGLVAGSYPAFFLSGFKPVKVLKGTFKSQTAVISPRKVLVVFQFTIALVLIVSTLIIYRQIKYGQERNNGYNRTNLIQHSLNGSLKENFDPLKNELISSGAAVAVAKLSTPITEEDAQTGGLNWGDMSDAHRQVAFSQFATTGDFIETFGLKLISGRDIDIKEYPADTASVLINEASAKAIGFKNPVGETLKSGGKLITIVGVFKDVVINSPFQDVHPMLVVGSRSWYYNDLYFRLNPANSVSKDMEIAAQVFKKYNPAYPFEYKFADDEYNAKFKDSVRTGSLAFIFAALTIIISCFGLFGLAAYMAESRAKEIGIRKVLGASVNSIVQLLTREFVVLVVIAIIIAIPVGWYAMSKWLQDFSYRITIGWVVFAVSGLLAIIIAVLTVSSQALRAAFANPSKTIRSE